jgi:hypothetical protein
MDRPARAIRRLARAALLLATTLVACASVVLWVRSYFRADDFDVGLWYREPNELSSREATIFTFRGGVGLLLRQRSLTLDPAGSEELGWETTGPSASSSRAIDRSEFAMGDPVLDVGGLYVGHADGPHDGYDTPSRVLDHVFAMPLWLLALLSGIWPINVVRRWRRQRHGVGFDVLSPASKEVALSPVASQP